MPRFMLILFFLASPQLTRSAYPTDGAPDVGSLVASFPSLDSLESRMAMDSATPAELPKSAHIAGHGSSGTALPGESRPFATEREIAPLTVSPVSSSPIGPAPLPGLLTDFESLRQTSIDLADQIKRKNQLVWNRYFFDRITASARTDYGNTITGVFVNGLGFGTSQQTFRQNYVGTYTLPLLQRYCTSTGWSRVFAGWKISSSLGAEPRLNQALSVPQLLNNLQLTWSVAFSYDLSGSTFRKLRDGQLTEEAALIGARERAGTSRDELLKGLASRVELLSSMPRRDDAHLASLRQLYSQFELFQARYHEARSCGDRMEEFYTLKGLALSLLTLSNYDPGLLIDWKRARIAACEVTTTADSAVDRAAGRKGREAGL